MIFYIGELCEKLLRDLNFHEARTLLTSTLHENLHAFSGARVFASMLCAYAVPLILWTPQPLTEIMKTDFVPFKPRVPRMETWCTGFFVPSPHTSNSATTERYCDSDRGNHKNLHHRASRGTKVSYYS
jgi:hypothetical protein